jgi:hypothetical protein
MISYGISNGKSRHSFVIITYGFAFSFLSELATGTISDSKLDFGS